MTVTITWQTLITAAAVVGAVAALIGWLARGVRFVDRQKTQDKEIAEIREKQTAEYAELKKMLNEELQLLTYGTLASLKGLKEQGCNGPVTEAINKIEKHLNKKAHE